MGGTSTFYHSDPRLATAAPLNTWLALLGILTTLVLSISVKPCKFRFLFVLPVLLLATYIVSHDEGSHAMAVNIIVFDLALRSVDFMILTDVQRVLRHKDQPKDEDISMAPFYKRLTWGLSLVCSPRGVGWTHEPILPPVTRNRTRFLLEQSFRVICCIVLSDMVAILAPYHAIVSRWSGAVLGGGLIGLSAYSTLGMAYGSLTIVAVGLGLWRPEECPWVYGRFRDAYTYRRFWGLVWHQVFRRPFTSPGRYLSREVFKLPRGSRASSLIQLYSAFFLSAALHLVMTYGGVKTWEVDVFIVFFAQASVVTLETVIISLGRRLGIPEHQFWRYVGYIWVAGCGTVLTQPVVRFAFRESLILPTLG
ncbi:membrane bound O-acyl transferase family-domain-containing protein [Desarmillaria tabescens]|uniref:Membrane bound O-acyl transferase family-domain-containing protein n=1 Tax=Armillaria tabescens TaxID=1929756 RepID=A0AA39JYE6_ARMTA|nr:membrane bound O-acyl transferase family-domain-containing protein [Desarmillaria tabescens]KAK0451225.1 membrane bound O-acyl transferase family-domain-containing protein [Desarmillaria tabescens]